MSGIAIIPGGFDPVTVGHMDMVKRALKLFDEVYVVIFNNTAKKYMFTAHQRLELLQMACDSLGDARVRVDISHGLLADYAAEVRASAIVKGVRSFIDFDYEFQLSLINRTLNSEPETIFLPTKQEHQYISSTFVREMIIYNKPLEGFIPEVLLAKIGDIITKNE